MNELILNIISVVVTAIIIPLITYGWTELIKFVKTKTNNEKSAENLIIITAIVTNSVKTVFQTYVDPLKKAEISQKKLS